MAIGYLHLLDLGEVHVCLTLLKSESSQSCLLDLGDLRSGNLVLWTEIKW